MVSARDLRLASIADEGLSKTKFTSYYPGVTRWICIHRPNKSLSFWLQYDEHKDFSHTNAILNSKNAEMLVLSHGGVDFFFHQNDFGATDMILLKYKAEGMDSELQELRSHKITALEFKVYQIFKHCGVYDPISVWEARKEKTSHRDERPILVFLCRMVHIASVLEDGKFGQLAVALIDIRWQHKIFGLADIELIMEQAPYLDNIVIDRIHQEDPDVLSKKDMKWLDRFRTELPLTFMKFKERTGLVVPGDPEAQCEFTSQPDHRTEYDSQGEIERDQEKAVDQECEEVADEDDNKHQRDGEVSTRDEIVRSLCIMDEDYVDQDFDGMPEIMQNFCATQPTDNGGEKAPSIFGAYYNKPLTGNPFYDRRPPPNFNLLEAVQKSAAAVSQNDCPPESSRASTFIRLNAPTGALTLSSNAAEPTTYISKPRPTYPRSTSRASNAPKTSLISNYANDSRSELRVERSRTIATMQTSAPQRFLGKREHITKEGSNMRPRHAAGAVPHRQFKPTGGRQKRRSGGFKKPTAVPRRE